MKYCLNVLRDCVNFSGRAGRREYWYFLLFNSIFGLAVEKTANALAFKTDDSEWRVILWHCFLLFCSIYSLAAMLRVLALTARRLHDVGKSGWFLLLLLIPIIGAIWLFVLLVTDSEAGENEYGENPKGIVE